MDEHQANSFLDMLTEGKEIKGVNTSLALNLIPLATTLGRIELIGQLLDIAVREAKTVTEQSWSQFERLKHEGGTVDSFVELALEQETNEEMAPFVAAVYHHVGLLHLAQNEIERAHSIATRAFRFREQHGGVSGKQYGLQLLCTTSKRMNDADGALGYATRLLELAIEQNDDNLKVEAYAEIGHIQATIGSFEEAMQALQHSLELANEIDDIGGILVASWSLADIAEIHEEYEQAMILLSTCVQEYMSRQRPAPPPLLERIEALTSLNNGSSQ